MFGSNLETNLTLPATRYTVRWILLILLMVSCSDNNGSTVKIEEPARLVLDSELLTDAYLLDWGEAVEEDACCGVPCLCGEEYEYQVKCWKAQLFFCTPNGGPPGDDPTLYQQAVIMDICDENGEPCIPIAVNDPDCQWEVVDMGECENWLECDPTDPNVVVSTDVPCTDVDENGVEFNGIQDFICQKGKILAGPCSPCGDEVCDGFDNDCDGIVDEGQYPCLGECGEGSAYCIAGELVNCNAAVPVPEICDNLDNDCDGETDEELISPCSTDCEDGIEFCVDGQWTGCTAKPPAPEECNGLDDDCDGFTDEQLVCACPPETIGFLVPCMESPLTCGQGFKTCECADEECTTTQMTECLAMCVWLPQPGEFCEPTLGAPVDELCNNFDDDCDSEIDENLFAECYTGPEDTINVGICKTGELVCNTGTWGNELDGIFVEDMCLGEITPLEEDLCTGNDDNCDGVLDKEMEETDVLFIVDTSGSMSGTISAVQQAMSMFSATYSDQEVIQWGLAIGPTEYDGLVETLVLETNLVPFQQFLPELVNIDDDVTSEEMLYDALYLSIRNLLPVQPTQPTPFVWNQEIASTPPVESWVINWRDDVNHVVIVFSDEKGQSHMTPEVGQQLIIDTATDAEELSIYTFSNGTNRHGTYGWEPVAINGAWSSLTSSPNTMFDKLMEIIDEEACGGTGGAMEARIHNKQIFYNASYWKSVNMIFQDGAPDRSVGSQWLHITTKQCIHPLDFYRQ